MEWQTSEAPVGRDIEFEIDGIERRRGQLSRAGKGGVGKRRNLEESMKPLFMVMGEEERSFGVTRWREIEDQSNV